MQTIAEAESRASRGAGDSGGADMALESAGGGQALQAAVSMEDQAGYQA
eukprot:COSAG01_NODE_21897_length_880_cov_2.563841_1_plen_48_part_10